MLIKHFVLTDDGHIREYSAEEAVGVISGSAKLPELADLKVRYLQVRYDDGDDDDTLQVITAGAAIRFDEDGRLCDADNLEMAEKTAQNAPITAFEQETCVQLALASTEVTMAVQRLH